MLIWIKLIEISQSLVLKSIFESFIFYRQSTTDHQDYINPYPVINIKLSIEGMAHEEIIVMRLDEKTIFKQIKETAFYYWKLDQATEQEEQSE